MAHKNGNYRSFFAFIFTSIFLVNNYMAQLHKELRLCTFHGTVADPSDCSAYYHCAEGKLYHYNCGRNSAFDPTLHTCVSPPSQVSCPNGQKYTDVQPEYDPFICSQDGYFRSPSDCTRFYRCSKETKHAFSCPLGMAFNAAKITCDPIDNVPDCQIEGGSFGTGPTFQPQEFDGQTLTIEPISEPMVLDSKMAAENGGNGGQGGNAKYRSNSNYLKSGPRNHDGSEGNSGQTRRKNKGDLFYLWNFDGQTDFDEYISLEEAASMSYKMPDFDTNPNTINYNKYGAASDKDVIIDFTDNPQPSILQNSSPPKPYAQIEPKIGSEAIAGYHVWDLNQNNPLYQNRNQPGYQYADPKIYRQDRDNNVPDWFYHDQYHQTFDENPNHGMVDTDDKGKLNSGISIELEYNSQNVDYTGKSNPGNSEEVAKQGMAPAYSSRQGHYGSIKPVGRTYRRPSPKLVPFDDRDPFQCPHDGYFRDEGDCSRFYHCTHGLPYMVKCNGGLYFNPLNKICDWPARVPGCTDRMRKEFVNPPRLNDPGNKGHIIDAQPQKKRISAQWTSDGEDTGGEYKRNHQKIKLSKMSDRKDQIDIVKQNDRGQPKRQPSKASVVYHFIHGAAPQNGPMKLRNLTNKLDDHNKAGAHLDTSKVALLKHIMPKFQKQTSPNNSDSSVDKNLNTGEGNGRNITNEVINVRVSKKQSPQPEGIKRQSVNLKSNMMTREREDETYKREKKFESVEKEKVNEIYHPRAEEQKVGPKNVSNNISDADVPDVSKSVDKKDGRKHEKQLDQKKNTPYIPVLVKNNDCSEMGYHRHPTDCTVFYRCTIHSKIKYRCETGMAYHTGIKACLPRMFVDGCT